MRRMSWVGRVALGACAAGLVIVACRNEVPGPTLPLPAPEVPPQAPRPEPLSSPPIEIDTDAGIPLPTTPEPTTRGAQRLRVNAARIAAAGDDPADASIRALDDADPDEPADAGELIPGDAGAEGDAQGVQSPSDANVDDALDDLPPLPDSNVEIVPDAAFPTSPREPVGKPSVL